MKLSIIIVSWNVQHDLVNCIKSILDNPPSYDFEIIVVDNNSADNTVKTVKNLFPDVILVDNKINLGFAAANNQGIE
ncbi:MAG TPA: glycosyltransferase [Sedimentisphaerales bacterium]|nr:glycosyltransferase [Sedimentisphaerales bacterium]